MIAAESCPGCGRPLDAHDRHIRFTLPDATLALPNRELPAGTWLSGTDPYASVMMQVPGVGDFVRALVPVSLSGGFLVTFGVWLRVRREDLLHAFKVRWSPEYPDLRLDAHLANAIPPWGLLGEQVDAVVRDPDATPYCEGSTCAELARVLRDEWPHEDVLAALP